MVVEGLAVGCAILASFKPVVGDQLYEIPDCPVDPIIELGVVQFKVTGDPASAVGGVLSTDIATTSVAVHPFVPVTVNVYVVVTLGVAVVGTAEALLKPVEGNQLYVFVPPVETPILTLLTLQLIVPLLPAFAVGGVLSMITVTISVATQPLAPVTVNE